MIYPTTGSKELKKELSKLKSYWSKESLITTRGLIYLCELMEKAVSARRVKRPLTDWQKFFGAQSKLGKSASVIAKEWRKRG